MRIFTCENTNGYSVRSNSLSLLREKAANYQSFLDILEYRFFKWIFKYFNLIAVKTKQVPSTQHSTG